MFACCCLPENFNTRPSPERNMHFEGPQNINQMGSPFMEKVEVCSSLLQKEVSTIVSVGDHDGPGVGF